VKLQVGDLIMIVELKSNKDVPNPDGSEPMEVDGTEVSKVVGQGETGSGEVKKSDEESKAATVASVGDSSTENASGIDMKPVEVETSGI